MVIHLPTTARRRGTGFSVARLLFRFVWAILSACVRLVRRLCAFIFASLLLMTDF
jgi:hypothetical protein